MMPRIATTIAAKSAKFVNALHNAGSGAELGVS